MRSSGKELPTHSRPILIRATVAIVALALVVGCDQPTGGPTADSGSSLVHLALRLDAAEIEAASVPEHSGKTVDWRFDAPLPDWRPLSSSELSRLAAVETRQLDDALRLKLDRGPRSSFVLIGGIAAQLQGLRLADWDTVLVKARSSDRFGGITLAYNLQEPEAIPGDMQFFESTDETPPIFNDGSVQTYAIPLRPREGTAADAQLDSLAVLLGAPERATVDILEVTLVPRGAAFREPFGAQPVVRGDQTRHTLFARTPTRIRFRVDVPAEARLDLGLSAGADETVHYRVAVDAQADASRPLMEKTVGGAVPWVQQSIDLTPFAGRRVELVLEADSDQEGSVALWGAPILSGAPHAGRPNVIFYIIDGAGADLMSVYGYERQTTPFLEELATEGAVFDWAYSNSTWTQPSTASFMTSLQHSVLGGLRRGVHSTAIPAGATTMAEHLRNAGYQTASFTANPNAGRIIGTERGVDLMRDSKTEHHSTSSAELHHEYWRFRDAYPGGPYWAHFQTADVHEPNQPQPPYAGRLVDEGRRNRLTQWDVRMFTAAGHLFGTTSIQSFYNTALDLADVDKRAYFETRRDLYDETMMHQDDQLRHLVDELKAAGEWQDTLLIIAADHGHPAGTFARFGRGLLDPQPEPWQGALFDAYATRVPMIWVWPGRIAGARRLDHPVSMIDVLPTLLDLLRLPRPEVLQGQSLAPLLLGDPMEVRPVIFDEFRIDEDSGEMTGNLEMIDGRWGASLEIRPPVEGADPELGRHEVPLGGRWGAHHPFTPRVPRLLLYDLESDPFATRAVNDEQPELVKRYRRLLLLQWKAHLALAQRFAGETEDVPLDPEQLEQLKALGYIQ